jgi:hypothetical protein
LVSDWIDFKGVTGLANTDGRVNVFDVRGRLTVISVVEKAILTLVAVVDHIRVVETRAALAVCAI